MNRRSFLRAGAAGIAASSLPRFSIAQPANARVLRFVPQANLTVLDPIITTAAVTLNHGWMVWDTLFGVNAAQQAKPQMAEGYTVSDDGRTYLIKLRQGLKWHDGEPVRAQDCAASLARWAVRDTFGQTVAKSVDAWGVAGDQTVKVTLKRPFPLLIDAIAMQTSFIMPERLAKTDPFKAITEIVGSGPFRFLKDEFVAGSAAAWEKFDGYVPRQEPPEWTSGGKVAHFQRIEWKIIPDAATASAALQNGEVDWYEQAQIDLVPLLRRNADIVIAPSNPQGYIGGMRFNCIQPPFDDVRLRRAVMVAVNQEDYMRAIMGDDHSAWRVCRSQYPCGTTYGTEVDLPVQRGDLAAAKKMIQEAGYNGQKAVIINPTDFATIGPLGDITYDMFKKIGINAELQDTDWGSVVQRRATREPVEKGGWSVFHTWFTGGFILNPVVTAPFRAQGAAGWFGWYDNPKVEQLTQEWLDAEDEDSRKKIAGAIQLENYRQAPTITLGQFQIPTAYNKSLAGKLEYTGPLFWNIRRV
ncbi:MAG TPA: ABC transporter substrate-binding protein [Acetobacteraceae bacterium]|jgi:peptide/nickel transport system substrate-binding protein|nr:ABC transporter substrate-binding protein [Acetobacteraceae bacterium]